jgi:hypothetical protein
MSKTLAILMIPLIMLSCSSLKEIPRNEVVDDQLKTEQYTEVENEVIPNTQLATPDSTKTIVVYNVIEADKEKGLSDETWRSFISQFFGTVSTIFALIYGTSTNP